MRVVLIYVVYNAFVHFTYVCIQYVHYFSRQRVNHGRINSLAGHTVYAYSSGLRAVQFLLRNYATRVDKKGIAPEQGFILLVI